MGLMTLTQARAALRRHRGVEEIPTPVPGDRSHVVISKRAAASIIADAEAVGAMLVVSIGDVNGFLRIGAVDDGAEVERW